MVAAARGIDTFYLVAIVDVPFQYAGAFSSRSIRCAIVFLDPLSGGEETFRLYVQCRRYSSLLQRVQLFTGVCPGLSAVAAAGTPGPQEWWWAPVVACLFATIGTVLCCNILLFVHIPINSSNIHALCTLVLSLNFIHAGNYVNLLPTRPVNAYRAHCLQGAEGWTTVRHLQRLPGEILRSLFNNSFRLWVALECVSSERFGVTFTVQLSHVLECLRTQVRVM